MANRIPLAARLFGISSSGDGKPKIDVGITADPDLTPAADAPSAQEPSPLADSTIGPAAVPVGRRAFFQRAAGAAAALPALGKTGGYPFGLSNIGNRTAILRIPFLSKKSLKKPTPIPGIGNFLGNLLSAEDSLGLFGRYANDIITGNPQIIDLLPSDIITGFDKSMGLASSQFNALDGRSRLDFAHTLALAERAQGQIDAWEIILQSPHGYQRNIAGGQHKIMLEERDYYLKKLGISSEQWEKLGYDNFGTRILNTLLSARTEISATDITKAVSGEITKERDGVLFGALKNLSGRAQWFISHGKDPNAAAAFFRRSEDLMNAIPLDTTLNNGQGAHAIFEAAADTFFGRHPELKPEGYDKARAEQKQRREAAQKQTEQPATDLQAAHDQLVIDDPEMATWLIRARVAQEQKEAGRKV